MRHFVRGSRENFPRLSDNVVVGVVKQKPSEVFLKVENKQPENPFQLFEFIEESGREDLFAIVDSFIEITQRLRDECGAEPELAMAHASSLINTWLAMREQDELDAEEEE